MTQFLQLHSLTSYPAANLNRDDAGRPKSLMFGGAERLRVSSQSLKRAWRVSPEFRAAVGEEHVGERSQEFGRALFEALCAKGKSDKEAAEAVRSVIENDKLGKLEAAKKKKSKKGQEAEAGVEEATPYETNQLVHLGQDELGAMLALANRLAAGEKIEAKQALILQGHPRAVDIALFGRMLADNPAYNVEGAAEVAHAFTTHRVTVEDDFYTAVDDLKARRPGADAGAGFLGVFEYGAGVFYQYANINLDLLKDNLGGDDGLARKAVSGLIEAMATVSPTGKQHATAARSRAHYLLLESGKKSPRTLANAFLRPVRVRGEGNALDLSIAALNKEREDLDAAFGACASAYSVMHVGQGGSLAECVAFGASQV